MSNRSVSRVSDPRFPLAIGGAALLALAPSVVKLAGQQWGGRHYSFTPLLVIALGAIGFLRWRDEGPFKSDFTIGTAVRWLVPGLLLAASIWLRRPWLASLSLVLMVRAFVFTIGGLEFYKSVRLAWWALWLIVPLPLNMDLALITSMQQFASRQASAILDLFGFRHLLTGVLLNFPGRSFEVEEACSGVHSLFASLLSLIHI